MFYFDKEDSRVDFRDNRNLDATLCDISKPKEQALDSELLVMTANAMLDQEAEEEFFSALYKEEA